LQRFYCKRRKVTNLALTGWGCYKLNLVHQTRFT
jgi:hypothetical protein